MGMLLRRHRVKPVTIDDLSLDDLKVLAKERGLKGVSKLSKEELLEKLKGTDS